MNRRERLEFNEYLMEVEEHEKEFESDIETFMYTLSDQDLDFLLDNRERAADMAAELNTRVK